MSGSDQPGRADAPGLTTVHLRWRGLAVALPALALLGGGLALAGSGAPAVPTQGAGASVTKGATLPAVPGTPFTVPGSSGGGLAPGLQLPPGGPGGAVTLDAQGIPGPALAAYHKAAGVVGNADPGCHIDWALIAAIGRVESDHGRYGGSALDAQGIDEPGVYGVELDGQGGTATIHDTDHGIYDHDTVWDRAVGPMQFIPGTWKVVGGDLDGDGVKNPQDINDAAAATAIYLCAGSGDLADPNEAYDAVLRYNDSDSYARTVLAIAQAYRSGVTMLPLSDLPAASGAGGSETRGSASAGGSTKAGGSKGSSAGAHPAASSTSSGSSRSGAAGSGNPAGGLGPVVTGVTKVLPTTLPSPVASVVCPIGGVVGGIGGGLGRPTVPPVPPVPIPGCPTPTPTTKH
jgi:hypothetical protein